MNLRAILSWTVAIALGLFAVAPPISYDFPMTINSFHWLYAVIAFGFLGYLLVYQDLPLPIKILIVYLFSTCFYSQDPAGSFNAYILTVGTLYFYLICKKCDFNIIGRALEIVFWFQVTLGLMQFFGRDTLMCFGSGMKWDEAGKLIRDVQTPVHLVYFGTVFQQMRLASLFAVMSPFLLMRNKWYIVPILITCMMFTTLGYTFAIVAGILVYVFFTYRKQRIWFLIGGFLFCVLCATQVNHIQIELREGRWPIWGIILKSWAFNTMANFHGFSYPLNPHGQTGPFCIKTMLFGHGMDTFITMFPFYKYDPNPFGQCHNDWLQILWEIGLVGYALVKWYIVWLWVKAFRRKDWEALAGMTMIAVNMFFAFPSRMMQTIFIIVAFAARVEVGHVEKNRHLA